VTASAKRSVYNGLTTIVAAEISAVIATRIARRILEEVRRTAFQSTVTPGSTAASAGAGGARIGSILPGKGTLVGLGVGLAVGILVDWWRTDEFRSKMSQELEGYLTAMKKDIVYGFEGSDGFKADFSAFSRDYSKAQGKVIKHKIMEVQ